jgi:hypothetical protein
MALLFSVFTVPQVSMLVIPHFISFLLAFLFSAKIDVFLHSALEVAEHVPAR